MSGKNVLSNVLKLPFKVIGWVIILFVALITYVFVFIFSITLSGNVVTPWHFFGMVIHNDSV